MNDSLDLVLEHIVDVPREAVWRAWTTPDLLVRWFTPAPWTTAACDLDRQPGGAFRTVMRSPEGEEFESVGCVLEVVPDERFVWTSALAPSFRPLPSPSVNEIRFTAVIELAGAEGGTRYRVTALHADEATERHVALGFEPGWGTALGPREEQTGTLGPPRERRSCRPLLA